MAKTAKSTNNDEIKKPQKTPLNDDATVSVKNFPYAVKYNGVFYPPNTEIKD